MKNIKRERSIAMFCSKCGKELQEGSMFCSSCGARVFREPASASEAVTASELMHTPGSAPAAVSESEPVPGFVPVSGSAPEPETASGPASMPNPCPEPAFVPGPAPPPASPPDSNQGQNLAFAPPPPAAGKTASLQDAQQAIGKKADYYLAEFERLRQGGKDKMNWAAFFGAFIHAVYRNVWKNWLKALWVPLILVLAIYLAAMAVIFSHPTWGLAAVAAGGIVGIWGLTAEILFAKRFNRIYMQHVDQALMGREPKPDPSGKRIAIAIAAVAGVSIAISLAAQLAVTIGIKSAMAGWEAQLDGNDWTDDGSGDDWLAGVGEDDEMAGAGENDWLAGSGEDGGMAAPGKDDWLAGSGEDGGTAAPGEDGGTAAPGEDGRTAASGEDGRTEVPGENDWLAGSGEDNQMAGAGENGQTASSSGPGSGVSGGKDWPDEYDQYYYEGYGYLDVIWDVKQEYGINCEYALHDMDQDGIQELIVSYGESNADYSNAVWTLAGDGIMYVGDFYMPVMLYEAEDGNGIFTVYGHQLYQQVNRITKAGYDLYSETILDGEIGETEDYYQNDSPIPWFYTYDLSWDSVYGLAGRWSDGSSEFSLSIFSDADSYEWSGEFGVIETAEDRGGMLYMGQNEEEVYVICSLSAGSLELVCRSDGTIIAVNSLPEYGIQAGQVFYCIERYVS